MIVFILISLLSCFHASPHEPDPLVQPREEGSVDPLEMADLFEGDIAGVKLPNKLYRKNAVKSHQKLWSEGVVPYEISPSFSASERKVIYNAMKDYHTNTCIKFVQRKSQPDYVYVMKGTGCSSYVGRDGGRQTLSLATDCLHHGIVIHELMHAVGFWHEQSRGDRNKYISVLWGNIKSGKTHNFLKYNWNEIQSLGVPYDTGSVMHYGKFSFSKSRRLPTIVSKTKGKEIGQRDGFSKADIKKLNLLYKCDKSNKV